MFSDNPYFPQLTEQQKARFDALGELYRTWNEQINVISRKDIDNLYERHVLHSLAIAKYVRFMPEGRVLDLGCGGGFPGIPLAIFFPETHFILVDSIGKKIKVAEAVAEALGLENVSFRHARAEDLSEKVDFVVSRAVAELGQLVHWTRGLISAQQRHGIPNGLIALKGGGRLKEEVAALGKRAYVDVFPIRKYFGEPFFEEKFVVYVQR
jgi:16S rRNA (guanine527-N7)-methyltransferase